MEEINQAVTLVQNPLVEAALAGLRNKDSDLATFRRASDLLVRFLFAEALAGLPTVTGQITTPLGASTDVHYLPEDIVIIPILRAGLAMLAPALTAIPHARIGFAGLVRDEKTAIAREYYWKIPAITSSTLVIITDPMLATGGSLRHVLAKLIPLKPREVRAVTVISAQEGLRAVQEEFPEVKIFTTAIDPKLNAQKYIVPGLGDYGDRYFGTF